jgi:hypothetical protein
MSSSRTSLACWVVLLASMTASSLASAQDLTPGALPGQVPAPDSPPASAPYVAWEQGAPVPSAYRTTPRGRKGFVVAGATLFTLTYLASAIGATTGYVHDADTISNRGMLWIPAVGPFIMMGNTSSAAGNVFLVLDGLAQVGGLTMFVYGLLAPKTLVVPDAASSAARISLVPILTSRSTGAALVGKF